MIRFKHQHRWLAVLTVTLLLMQSFALWHDTVHDYHEHVAQCERYEAYGHTPALDVVSSPYVVATTNRLVDISVTSHVVLVSRQRESYSIRAPPLLFS